MQENLLYNKPVLKAYIRSTTTDR